MADSEKEYEVPVKVVDRRWWANPEAGGGAAAGERTPLKPTYVEELEEKVAQKDREIQEYIAKYRQANAEFEGARARLRKEISKDIERARREVLSELLEVMDNLDRAIDASRGAASVESVLQGIDMVRRQFLSKLESLGVSRIAAEGEPFDPHLHEAITTVPASAPDQDGRIVGVIRHGYRIGEDILRPAAVAVAQNP